MKASLIEMLGVERVEPLPPCESCGIGAGSWWATAARHSRLRLLVCASCATGWDMVVCRDTDSPYTPGGYDDSC